ncbi:hypothetical protein JCM14036_30660 [Desulfotomaculum defluvii]
MLLVIILSFLITAIIHEMGHCWGIYKFGYRPTSLSVGFGRPLLTIRYRGIPCSICPLPFGASVEVPPTFDNEKWWKKLVVDIAGPLVNIVVGFSGLIITLIALCISRGYSLDKTSQVLVKFMGFLPSLGRETVSAFQPESLLGIGMDKHAESWAQMANSDFSWLAALVLFFTINLGIGFFNLVPFPSLDGYHVLENIFQGITGKRIPSKINVYGFMIVLIISMVTFLTFFGYPVLYAWTAVLFGFLLALAKHINQKRKRI